MKRPAQLVGGATLPPIVEMDAKEGG